MKLATTFTTRAKRAPTTRAKKLPIEPCHHCWAYYQSKVDARRAKKLPCSQLENKMWDYSLHAAFPFGVVCCS